MAEETMIATMSTQVSTPSIDPAPRDAVLYYASVFSGSTERTSVELTGGGEAFTYGAVAEAGKPLVVSTAGASTGLFLPGEWVAGVLVEYRIDSGPWKNAAVDDPLSSGRFNVPPQARALAYRYVYTTSTGRTVSDDAQGKNYALDVIPPDGTAIAFYRAWQEVASGPIKAGGTVRLSYDVNRLLDVMTGTYHNGAPVWDITAYIEFDGHSAIEVPLVGTVNDGTMIFPQKVPVRPAIKVPEAARSMAVWFRGSALEGVHWDSHYGTNYTFAVHP